MASAARERPELGARPCLHDMPYRAVVFHSINQHRTPLYLVARSVAAPMGAEKALKRAFELHGGNCFYCGKKVGADEFTLDHAEPAALGGTGDIQNLLIACRPCNVKKGHRPIEAFSPGAGRKWLKALLDQVEERLKAVGPDSERPA